MPEFSTPADRDAALEKIRTAMVEKKMTQAELADAADCHEKTIQNLLGGRSVRDQTLFDVCMVLDMDFTTVKDSWTGHAISGPMELRGEGGLVAPVYMGAYTRAATDHFIGTFLTLRPAFSKADTIIAYRTDVIWDADWPSLLFEESQRPDSNYQHRGRIYVPASSMFIHLVSLTKGAMRMVMVSQIDQAGYMRGIITTLHRRGAMIVPVSSPIVYVQTQDLDETALGEITPAHENYEKYRALIDEAITDGYAKMVKTPGDANL